MLLILESLDTIYLLQFVMFVIIFIIDILAGIITLVFWLFLPIDTAAAACTMEMMAARQPGMQATWSGTLNGSSGATALFPHAFLLWAVPA